MLTALSMGQIWAKPPSTKSSVASAPTSYRASGSPLDECEQILVDLVLVDRTHAVRSTLINLQGRALDEFGLKQGCIGIRHDLIVVALQDQGRDVEFLQVLGLIRLGERLDAEVRRRKAGHYSLEPEGLAHPFRDLRTRTVVAVERHAEILPELRPVGLDAGADLV